MYCNYRYFSIIYIKFWLSKKDKLNQYNNIHSSRQISDNVYNIINNNKLLINNVARTKRDIK